MNQAVKNLIKMALAEDLGPGDVTSSLIIPKNRKVRAVILAKERGLIAGLPLSQVVYNVLDKRVKFKYTVKDGQKIKKGLVVAELTGPARSILAGERLALNLLQHLSGIATLTSKFVALAKPAIILDTRKTTPLWRGAEKYAVLAGGGHNHRMGLYDAILIKDNHIKLVGDIGAAFRRTENKGRGTIEIETKNLKEVKEAIAAGADRILLDNMGIKSLREAVVLCKKAGIKTEASGGINLKNVKAIAQTGVNYISVGALTHSAPALDLSLKIA